MDGRWEVRIPSFLEIWKTGLLSMWGVGLGQESVLNDSVTQSNQLFL